MVRIYRRKQSNIRDFVPFSSLFKVYKVFNTKELLRLIVLNLGKSWCLFLFLTDLRVYINTF